MRRGTTSTRLSSSASAAWCARPGGADGILAELSDVDLAGALGVLTSAADGTPQPTLGAMLMFGGEEALHRFVPTHEAAFQVLSGLSVQVNEFYRWPLFRLAEEMLARFRARNSEEEIHWGLLRVPVPAYSEVAFREALANALIHRDYTVRGAVHVLWGDDAIVVSSPGGLPPGIRVDNLLVVLPRPRNPLLADAFKRAGIVERTGRGVNRMFEAQLRFGRQAPDYGRTSEAGVVAVLPGGAADLRLTRYVLELDRAGRPLSLAELQVLTELLRERRLSAEEIARLVQRTQSESRTLLARMVERGFVEARGERKGRTYHLSAPVYRSLDEAGEYVRVRSYEPLQQEQMVLSYVDAHGRITRSQAAELCALDPQQAGRLLRRLVTAGALVLRGERRGAYYQRP